MPTQRKRTALNMAWVSRWKKASDGAFSPKAVNITPNWLSVEKATTFFASNSALAATPAISIVIQPTKRKMVGRQGV